MIKTQSGDVFFGHGKSFLNSPLKPRVGRQVTFTPLPPSLGPMKRAIEIEIRPATKGTYPDETTRRLPASPQPAAIVVQHLADGRARLVLQDNTGERVLSDLTF